MDGLSALGLASNVIQFISFASDLISKSTEIHGSTSGCTSEVLTLHTVYGHLSELSSDLRSCSQTTITGWSKQLATNVSAIMELSRSCKTDCDKLLEIVRKLKPE